MNQKAWNSSIDETETGISNGECYDLSFVRDCMNSNMDSSSQVTNREVKALLMNYFGNTACFSQPKQVNKSVMFFVRI